MRRLVTPEAPRLDLLAPVGMDGYTTRHKGAMIEISHAREDAALAAGIDSSVYANFQLASLYRKEAPRYATLIERGVQPTTWCLCDVALSPSHRVVALESGEPWRPGGWS